MKRSTFLRCRTAALAAGTLLMALALPIGAQQGGGAGSGRPGGNSGTGQGRQRPQPPATPPGRPMWDCSLPSGNYLVALDNISSVSMQSYLVKEAPGLRVWEVDVAEKGSVVARFYAIEAVQTPAGVGQTALDRSTSSAGAMAEKGGVEKVWQSVTKDSSSTHAHTIDFRIDTVANLDQLHLSARDTWQSGKSGTFSLSQ